MKIRNLEIQILDMKSLLVPQSLSIFPEFLGGFSLPVLGNQSFFRDFISQEITQQNRKDLAQALGIPPQFITAPRLIHSSKILVAKKADQGKGGMMAFPHMGEGDGVITKTKNIYPLITAADCLPILLWDPKVPIWGAIHAGRRGLEQNIITKGIQTILELGGKRENIYVALGPCIHPCCYDVDEKTMNIFRQKRGSQFVHYRNQKYYLDLPGSAIWELEENQIPSSHIEWIEHCTYCHKNGYFSARRDGVYFQTFAAIIGVQENE